jgi:hypothetical protein
MKGKALIMVGTWLLAFPCEVLATSQEPRALSVSADSQRWVMQDQAKAVSYRGRKCLMLNGGTAMVKDFDMRDGVVDVDAITSAPFGFFGFQFHIDKEHANFEELYLRQHKSGFPGTIQYTPVLKTGRNWQLFNGPGFTDSVDIPKDAWFHLRLVVTGAQAKLYVKDMDQPALVMDDLKSGIQKGPIALFDLAGATCFSNFEVRTTSDVPWMRHLPPMQPNVLIKWQLSPSYNALEHNLEKPLTPVESARIEWQEVDAESPGLVVIYRYRKAPHPRVSFQGDFSTRLQPQSGMQLVYARTTIDSDRDQVKRLAIGYSDDVSVFLNGKILYRGRSAQSFRDPEFLGIVSADNDAVYLPLKKGSNELVLAISELGGGWGFICRLEDIQD